MAVRRQRKKIAAIIEGPRIASWLEKPCFVICVFFAVLPHAA